MLTKNDRKALELLERYPIAVTYGIWVVPLFFAASAILQVLSASGLVENTEMALMDAVYAWYSGGSGELGRFGELAVLRVERAFGAATNCLLSAGLAYGFVAFRLREQRLIAVLQEAGRW